MNNNDNNGAEQKELIRSILELNDKLAQDREALNAKAEEIYKARNDLYGVEETTEYHAYKDTETEIAYLMSLVDSEELESYINWKKNK